MPPLASQAGPPLKGWAWWGWGNEYEYGVSDDQCYQGHRSVYIRSIVPHPQFPGVGLVQTFKAEKFRNKRIKYSAVVKSEATDGSAALSMNIEGTCHAGVSYDEMFGRNVSGSIPDWKELSVVLDVPKESTFIRFGIKMSGKGQFWASGLKFEETTDEPTGRKFYEDEPTNLDFSDLE